MDQEIDPSLDANQQHAQTVECVAGSPSVLMSVLYPT